jgi:hypothetical protein
MLDNSIASALKPFKHMAGFAGAVLSFWQILGGALFGIIVAHFGMQTMLQLGIMLFLGSLLACISQLFAFLP